jgi:hypothetical protein
VFFSVYVLSVCVEDLRRAHQMQSYLPTAYEVNNFKINPEWEQAKQPNPLRHKKKKNKNVSQSVPSSDSNVN